MNYVINFDLPDMAEDYVHRIGRTGRAGEEGFAISFVTRETVKTLREIEKLINKEIPFTTIENYETDPSILEKPKRGGAGGKRNKPAGARRAGEKRFERAEREGRRPSSGNRREDARSGGRRGARDDRRGHDNRPGRGNRDGHRGDRRFDRNDHRGGNGGRRGSGKNGEWLSDEEFRAMRNAKNAQARMRKKDRKNNAAGKPSKGRGKQGGGNGGYDYSRFSK